MRYRNIFFTVLLLFILKLSSTAQTSGMVIYEKKRLYGIVPDTCHLYFSNEKSVYFYNRGEKKIILTDQDGNKLDFKKFQKDIERNGSGGGIHLNYIDEGGELVYMNWRKDSLIFRMTLTHDPIIVIEPHLPKINWEITNISKKIGNFECTKATTIFRGRKYEAWFTPEIPVPSGPWKLHGLPGLILEANDSSMKYVYKFKSIEIPAQNSVEIIVPPRNGMVIPLALMEKTIQEKWEEHVRKSNSTMTSRGGSLHLNIVRNRKEQELNFDD